MSGTDNKKHVKFRELAEKRTTNALEAIRKVGNLSNRSLYEWEDVEIQKIIKALKGAVSEIDARFKSPEGKKNVDFKL